MNIVLYSFLTCPKKFQDDDLLDLLHAPKPLCQFGLGWLESLHLYSLEGGSQMLGSSLVQTPCQTQLSEKKHSISIFNYGSLIKWL